MKKKLLQPLLSYTVEQKVRIILSVIVSEKRYFVCVVHNDLLCKASYHITRSLPVFSKHAPQWVSSFLLPYWAPSSGLGKERNLGCIQ